MINLTAWFSVLYQCNYFIFLQRVCSKVILSGCPDGHCHLIYVIATAIGWTIPHGLKEIANVYHVVWSLPSCFRRPGYVWLVEPYHVVPLKLSAVPKHGIWVHVASFFLHNTVTNMLCRLFDDRKYMDIYLPIPLEDCYLGKQKNSLDFFASACEHL